MRQKQINTGVYVIRHIASGVVYVGSAAVSFRKRWQRHKRELEGGIHHNARLQSAWNLEGETAFEWVILERVLPELCVEREQHWLDLLCAADGVHGYNIYPTADSPRGIKRSPEHRIRQSIAMKGRVFTAEHRANLSGQNNHNAVGLTADQVREIRIRIADPKPENSGRALAEEFGVSNAVVYRIAAGTHFICKEIGETEPILIPRRQRSEEYLAKLVAVLPRNLGEKNINAKLTKEQVREIRRRYIHKHPVHGAAAMARELNVTNVLILAVVKRRIWKHVA